MKIDLIAGARPNFMKIAPIIDAINKAQNAGENIHFRLIHTGQHYDKNMSDSFFEQLGIPEPNTNLGAGGGTQAEQTAAIMIGYERLLLDEKSDLCLVVGDVTSTMACSIVAQKLHIPVAHVEAGIRSGDWTMPEEINRMVTDSITNYFFTTTPDAGKNLNKIGITDDRIHWVGNTMIDTLVKHRSRFQKPEVWVPTGITRNKDGLNDIWGTFPVFVREYSMLVYDRWGNILWESNQKKNQWDATVFGKDLPDGVYAWKVDFWGWDNKKYTKTGTVTVIH